MSFGKWLLAQADRDGDIGDLARAAAKDPAFPRSGDPDAVCNRIKATMADGDAWATARAAVDYWREEGGR